MAEQAGIMDGVSSRMVLLGAGASADAGLPMSFEMTQRVVAAVNEPDDVQPLDLGQALNYVCGALMAYDGADGKSPYEGLDVERVFAAVELLARRRKLEVTPFVSAWHPAVDGWDRSAPDPFFDNQLKDALRGSTGGPTAAGLIRDLIVSVTGGGTGGTYEALMGRMIHHLVILLESGVASTVYLDPLVDFGSRLGLTIATLNYDLTIEQSASRRGVECYTGIEDWSASGQWNWPETGVRLLKLHGSIDWEWMWEGPHPDRLQTRTIRSFGAEEVQPYQRSPALVFGHGSKLRARGPFLSMLTECESLLRAHQHLIVIGYSFRDDHINELVRRWLNDDVARQLTIVDPNFPSSLAWSDPPTFLEELNQALVPSPAFWPGREHEFSGRLSIRREAAPQAIRALFATP